MKLDKFTVKQLAEIDACTRCGNCLDLCTAALSSNNVSISPKKKMEKLKKALNVEFGILAKILNRKLTKEEIKTLSVAAYSCTLCSRCEVDCHLNIKLQDTWLKLREILTGENQYPEILGTLRNRLKKAKNVSFDTNEGRVDWINKLQDIPDHKYIKEKAEVIYFVGCVSSFSPRVFKIPRAAVQIFKTAGVDFGLLGDEEWCCGFPLLTSGFREDFIEFAEHNIDRINATGAKYLVTSCPSCFHMWKHTYGEHNLKDKMNFEVMHSVQFVYKLAKDNKIKLNPIQKTVTYHDPCDLGRSSGVYSEPRELIKMIPGIKFVELANNKQRTTCCGGGGNVEASDPELSSKIAGMKAEEIKETGADIIVTSCQQCVRTIQQICRKKKIKIKVRDLIQLVLESMQAENE